MSDPYTDLCIAIEKSIKDATDLKGSVCYDARKISLVITKLEEAKLWLKDSINLIRDNNESK